MATAHVAANDPDQAWLSLLGRLNRQSVSRHFDAYADIDWDSPDMALDPEDARWELPADDPLGGTAWKLCTELGLTRAPYRALWRLLRLEAGPRASG